MEKEVRQLRGKLPAKGYSEKIIAVAKKELGVELSEAVVFNFFSKAKGRPVSEDAQIAIIKAAKIVIKKQQKHQEFKRKLATLI